MRSCISGSNAAPLAYIKVSVALCAVLVIAIEIGARLLTQYSVTHRRIVHQYAQAVGSRPSRPGDAVSVLMVGNSLLLDGLDLDQLQRLTSSKVRLYPIFLEGTAYYDWLYGLQRLFRRGARPQVVIVGLGMDGLLENTVRQEYAPRMLFDARDILGVSSDLRLNHTVTASLLLAHWSTFWDMRHVMRLQILRRSVPYFEELYLADLFSNVKATRIASWDAESEAMAISRLQRLRQLGESYGAKVVILIPPTPSSPSAVRQMIVVAQKVGVETLMPVDPTTLAADFYLPDEIHLNETGAALFTSALGADLSGKIGMREPATPRE